MAKFLLLCVVLAAVYFLWKGTRIAKPPKSEQRSVSSEPIVRCAHCGVYIPQTEALGAPDEYFCCEEHRRAGRSEFEK
jgi:uncharacterized protein